MNVENSQFTSSFKLNTYKKGLSKQQFPVSDKFFFNEYMLVFITYFKIPHQFADSIV